MKPLMPSSSFSREILFIFTIVILVHAVSCATTNPVTFEKLLDDMVNLQRLATMPEPGERCIQFSSYDRKCHDPKDWFANGDYGQYLRTEKAKDGREEFVMADVEGPGAIVRIWSANAMGNLHLYIDEGDEPDYTIPFKDLCDGTHAPYLSPISGIRAKGWNCYLPFPFAKHLKVSVSRASPEDQLNRLYYHVNVRLFPQGTPTETFTPELLEKHAEKIAKTGSILERPDVLLSPPGVLLKKQAITAELKPDVVETFTVAGPATIRALTLKFKADKLEPALRYATIMIRFDGEACPSVRTPLGDFFGTAPGLDPFLSLPLGVREDGTAYCHFPMPFAEKAEISLIGGREMLSVSGEITYEPEKNPEKLLRFHAGWRAAFPIATRPYQDWAMLVAEGKGRYVGCMISVYNPTRRWWGEGDEHFYVDGEEFPSTFGTGTEDYFGYAWCNWTKFAHAYHNQPRCDGPFNAGYTVNSRFHVLDDVPFQKSFKFDMEIWHQIEVKGFGYAGTTYWYATPGSTDEFPDITDEMRTIQPPFENPRKTGVIEAEELQTVRVTGGEQKPVDTGWWLGDATSGGKVLEWSGVKEPGGRIDMEVNSPANGKYRVVIVIIKNRHYGIFQPSIDGKPCGMPMDFYNKSQSLDKPVTIATVDLSAGTHTLSFEVTGKNEASAGFGMAIDYIRLEPVTASP